MIGRRIPVGPDGMMSTPYPAELLPQPGDYCGPMVGYTGDLPCVMYRLPNGSIGHVTSPPHTFRECPDGSLEIRASIGHTGETPDLNWHGYLDEGHVWRTV